MAKCKHRSIEVVQTYIMEMKQLLTNSSLTVFKTCPRRYQFQYEMGYVPAYDGEALSLGKLVHAGLEGWALGGHDLDNAIFYALQEYEKYKITDEYVLAKANAMLSGYHERYKDEAYEVVFAERELTAPLLNPDTAAESKTYILGMKLDRILKDKFGRNYLLETKTTADDIENVTSDYWIKLALDSQVSTYYLGAESNGIKLENCIYDVLKKPGSRPKQVGKEIDPANPKRTETPTEYFTRLKTEILANLNKYYARCEVPRSKTDLQDFLFDVWHTSQTLMVYQNKNKFPRNTSACTSHFGRCPYLDVCAGRTGLDNTSKFLKLEGSKHRELEVIA